MYTRNHNNTIENATQEMPLIKYFIVYHRGSPLEMTTQYICT